MYFPRKFGRKLKVTELFGVCQERERERGREREIQREIDTERERERERERETEETETDPHTETERKRCYGGVSFTTKTVAGFTVPFILAIIVI